METFKPFLIGLVVFLVSCNVPLEALLCFETDFDTGRAEVKNCPNCTYCVITSDGRLQETIVFGLSNDNEDLQKYNNVFSSDKEIDGLYKVLSFCMFERYFVGKREYVFRCMCNSNLCNGATTISEFLDRQVELDSNVRKMF